MSRKPLASEFLQYIATHKNGNDDPDRLPSLGDLSAEIGISVPKLREQMEAARHMGLVEARPRIGIRRKPYTFSGACSPSGRNLSRSVVAETWLPAGEPGQRWRRRGDTNAAAATWRRRWRRKTSRADAGQPDTDRTQDTWRRRNRRGERHRTRLNPEFD
jgi:DNA-binding transcriptional MocR family regulator